jgi:hypothetical protein
VALEQRHFGFDRMLLRGKASFYWDKNKNWLDGNLPSSQFVVCIGQFRKSEPGLRTLAPEQLRPCWPA